MHYLVFHLTIADAIVCFITMPMETIWRYMEEVFNKHKDQDAIIKDKI